MVNSIVLLALLTLQAKTTTPQVDIKDDAVGTGPLVKTGDIVAMEYSGKLTDGTEFDSNVGKAPIMFMVGVGQTIKGWDLGVAGMHQGGKREITIPPSLGYGNRQVATIPANSTLHFTVSLIKIEPKVDTTTITPGKGEPSKFGDKVVINFVGGIKGGKVLFDTHDANVGPVQMIIGEGNLPIGFMAALIGMKEGEKRKATIPSDLAYGKAGVPPVDKGTVKAGSVIPPDTTMEFTFELVKLGEPKS